VNCCNKYYGNSNSFYIHNLLTVIVKSWLEVFTDRNNDIYSFNNKKKEFIKDEFVARAEQVLVLVHLQVLGCAFI